MTRNLKKLIDEHLVISFDIYDTLIFRACGESTKVFGLVAEKCSIDPSVFTKDRIDAERRAREVTTQEEISIDDIYDELAKIGDYNID